MAELKLSDNIWSGYIKEHYIRGVWQEQLQKLLLLRYVIFYPDGGMSNELEKRCVEKKIVGLYHERMIEAITINEIMDILKVSRKRAVDYKKTLAILYRMM